MFKAFIGLDGFVDEVVHVVRKRFDSGSYERINTLTEYGNKIAHASGLSLNVEIETVLKKLGGNGPIFAMGLKKLGTEITYIGCTGKEAMDPVFGELAEGAVMIGVADPGRTDAMEFDDGKIIRGKLSSVNKLSWETITEKAPVEQFAEFMDRAQLISFNNWTMIPSMNVIWTRILSEVVPQMREGPDGKVMFFDFADPEKRKDEDLLEALDLIKKFKAAGFEAILGLNRKEACEIVGIIRGRKVEDFKAIELRTLCELVADYMEIDCVIVHPVENAACIKDGVYYSADGPYCAKPVLTTGAGDNFNSGFIYGYLNGLYMEDCLLLGAASSGFYVRNARSADIQEIRLFTGQWNEGALD
jgi:sugar/nucleoside kinase (ribokinase family)